MALNRGVTLVDGRNGHGKTNLLEAIYLMAIGRSSRGAPDRQMVRAEALKDFITHTQVLGDVYTLRGAVSLQVDLSSGIGNVHPQDGMAQAQTRRIQKTFKVNGVSKRLADFVGTMKAVLFVAEDIDLLSGAPAARRRYIDILASQLMPGHVREAQDYQRALTQRNHLLKSIRERESRESELEFWDVQLSIHTARIMDARIRVVNALNAVADPIHRELSGLNQRLSLRYAPSFEPGDYEDVRDISKAMLNELSAIRRREIGAGFCLIGAHRDDFSAELGGMDVGAYASRGQTRTAILGMKLGEAQLISDSAGDKPLILLDDVMSELDAERRGHVFERIKEYEQVIITTAEGDHRDLTGDYEVGRITIDAGRVASSG